MKIKKPKRIMSLFLAALMCVTSLVGIGTTAYAAEETDDVYLISYPRDGDSNYNAEWGHGSLTFMNGWKTGTSRYTTVRAMGSYNGNICYCIEIGVPQQTGDSFTKKGEDFWDNYPSSYNSTISPDDIKLFIGRIFQYGYTGTISTSWRSQNEGGDKLAHAVATQLLIWETVIGERDENFNKVSTGGKDAVLDQISPNHPLYDKIMSYYNSMAASVQKHSKLPSFLTKTPGSAQEIELEWDGSKYTVTLTDSNNVLSGYKFSSNDSGVQFSVSGNKLTITAEKAPSDGLTITAEKTAQRKGVITWTDGKQSSGARPPRLSPEEYAAKKKAEKEAVYQLLDNTALEVVQSPEKFRAYLDVQSRMDRYTANNALLMYKQFPQASQIKEFDDWAAEGVKVNKGSKTFIILDPYEYTKKDGTIGIDFNLKRVLDVSQTNGKRPSAPTANRDPRKLVAVMLDSAPINIESTNELPYPDMGAFYKNEDQTLYVKRDIGDSVALCQCVAQELGHAELSMNSEVYSRRDMGFQAVCIGYMLCKKYGVDTQNFAIDRIPDELKNKEPKDIKAELGKTQKAFKEITARVSDELYRQRAERSKEQER